MGSRALDARALVARREPVEDVESGGHEPAPAAGNARDEAPSASLA